MKRETHKNLTIFNFNLQQQQQSEEVTEESPQRQLVENRKKDHNKTATSLINRFLLFQGIDTMSELNDVNYATSDVTIINTIEECSSNGGSPLDDF